MNMQRQIKTNKTRRRPGPGDRSSNTPVAKDGGQDPRTRACGSEDSVRAAGGPSVQSICRGPLHITWRQKKSVMREGHHRTAVRTTCDSTQNRLCHIDGGHEL